MRVSDLRYFFTYETSIPENIGFPLFGVLHLLWLVFLTFFCFLYVKQYAKRKAGTRRRMECAVAFSLLILIVLRAIYIAVIGADFLYELPLHLCSMAGILCVIHCLTGWQWLGQVLYGICLPGTILALLFPNWNFYPAIHFITLEGFLFHIGIVMYVACELYSHKIVPRVKNMWQVFLFLTVIVVPIYVFDKHYDVNYMFVNSPSAGSPLEWLEHWMGNPGYLIGYAALMILCVFCMDYGYERFTS